MTSIIIKTTVWLAFAFVGIVLQAGQCRAHRTATAQAIETRGPRFAIAGLIDLDKDGKSDITLMRRLITMQGGTIDAVIQFDGKTTGRLRRDTAYVIVGDFPDNTTVSPRVAQQFDAFMRRVTELKIRVIQVDKLLSWGDQRTTSNPDTESLFRQRRAPQSQRQGSAY